MAVPKLRFKEFDGDWSESKLKDLVRSLDAGISVNGEDIDVTEDDFSVLKTSCVSLGTFNSNERKKVTLEHEIQRLKEPLLDNSLVMNRSNTPLLVGSSAFIKKAPKKTYLSDKLWQFKVNQNANIQWIAFYFSNETTLIKLRDMATGTSNSMKNITKPDVLNIDLFAPQKAEQTKIASFLSNVDEKISQLNQKHELLSQYKQGMMQKLFSQQLRFKADDGSEFGEWEETELGKHCQIKTGKLDANAMRPNGEFRFYTCAKEFYLIDEYAFDTEALLISGNGANVGYIHYYKGKFNAYQRTYVLDQWQQNIIFIQYFLEQFLKERIYGEKKEGNTPYIVLSTLSEMPLLLPCLEEQTKIANFLSAIDQKIEVVAQQIEQAKTWKKGLLQQMFV